jgi:23S rRNA pseudouridine1911/1915/1917 synthase
MEHRLQAFLGARDGGSATATIGLPHRLDRPVSGTLLVACSGRMLKLLGGQFQSRRVGKEYLALVEGEVSSPRGTWRDVMRKVPGEARAEPTEPGQPEAREAVLHFRVLQRSAERSLLAITLETGRMHQIRLQAARRGFPILGDTLYGASASWGPPPLDARQQPIALHARRIAFHHPRTAKRVTVAAPLPGTWDLLPDAWHVAWRADEGRP